MSNHANMLKWAQALESGEFEQGSAYLLNADGKYCCLGVACELVIAEGVPMTVQRVPGSYTHYDQNFGYLPPAVRDWLGVTGNNVTLPIVEGEPLPTGHAGYGPNSTTSATAMNDALRYSFAAIAAAIRKRVALEKAGRWDGNDANCPEKIHINGGSVNA